MAEFLEGRQSLGGCGRCLKDCETWPLSGCNVLPSRIWSYVERRSWLVRGEEGRYTEEGTRGKYGGRTRGSCRTLFSSWFKGRKKVGAGRIPPTGACLPVEGSNCHDREKIFVSSSPCFSSRDPFLLRASLLVLVIDDHEHQIRGKNSNTSLEQYLAKYMHASEIRRSV